MLTRSVSLVLFFSFVTAGCYHATVETGLRPSAEVIDESWAASWIYGLVPPSTIAAQAKCKNGVAKVETQLSFVNQLVGILTGGIYTPMSIKVTCAAGGSSMLDGMQPDIVLDRNANELEIQNAFARAAEMAVANNRPIYVRY